MNMFTELEKTILTSTDISFFLYLLLTLEAFIRLLRAGEGGINAEYVKLQQLNMQS
jgi:hypothetical protein